MVLEPKYFLDKNRPSWNSVICTFVANNFEHGKKIQLGGAVQAQQV